MARNTNTKAKHDETPATAPIADKPVEKLTTAEKWAKVASHFIDGKLAEALASVGWDFSMKPTPRQAPGKSYKDQLAVRQTAVKERMAAGETPFAEGSKSNTLFDMLKTGTSKTDIMAAFPEWKENTISYHVSEIAALVGYDVAATKFKSGKVVYAFDVAE